METLILTLDTIALMVVLYFSYRRSKVPGQPELGPFRIRTLPPDRATATPGPRNRVAPKQVGRNQVGRR